MDILVTTATPFEIAPALEYFNRSGSPKPRFHVSGVGSVATTYNLVDAIRVQRPAVIIQAGIAGAFEGQGKGPVIVNADSFADLGVWEEGAFRDLGELGLAPARDSVLPNPYSSLIQATGLPAGRGITINEITTLPERIRWYQQNLSPVVESMEGAALHFVCLRENIPFLQLRSVSNQVGVRDKSQWDIKGAVSSLNDALITIVKKIILLDETYFRI